ncbi:MAG: DNA-binding protein [Eubacteriaceae bacterium]|nr:DNA-binding protein [Eubacteriaceae bacterium]
MVKHVAEYEMEKRIRDALLLDLYGALLTERQNSLLECFLCEDLTITEIAGQFAISPQAASDIVKRAQAALEGYERKLRHYEKLQAGTKLLDRLEAMSYGSEALEIIEKLRDTL